MNLMNTPNPNPTEVVYVVDDDEAVRDSLTWLLESNGYLVRCHASAERFLQSLQSTDSRLFLASFWMCVCRVCQA